MTVSVRDGEPSAEVVIFLDTVCSWPPTKWRDLIATWRFRTSFPQRSTPSDHALVRTLPTEATFAIMVRPVLPSLDFARVIAPFPPLQLP